MGGISLAQPGGGGEPISENPLPANLRHGINIPWVFGNADYLYAWNNTAYNPGRLHALLTTPDFNTIRNARTTEPRFDHVRIPVDPTCLGVGPSGVVPSWDMSVDNPILALRATINEAIGEGLAVIIAFHPGSLNEFHWNKGTRKYIGDVLTNPPYHPTAYKLPFVTSDPPTGPVPDTHPLVRFWETFAPYLADLDKSKVYLSLMDEPLVSYENSEMGTNLTGATMEDHRKNWRNIQLKVIQKLRAHSDTRVRNFWLVASSYTGQSNDLNGWADVVGIWPIVRHKDYMVDPAEVKPYSYSEVPNGKVIYGFSFYHPMRYTHWNWQRARQPDPYYLDPNYDQTRDFLGIINTAVSPSAPPEDETAVNGWYTWDRSMERMLIELSQFQMVTEDYGGGLSEEYWVPMYINGFGSYLRQGTTQGTQEFPPNIDPMAGGNAYADLNRRRWHYDARKGFEQRGIGWSVRELFNGFNTWTGRLHGSTINTHGDWEVIDPYMRDALFGSARP